MHPIQMRTAANGLMKGRQKKAGFIGPLLGALAGPLIGSVVPSIMERILPRRGGKKSKGGLAPPYGGGMCSSRRGGKSKRLGRGAFQPGPLA